MTKKSLEYIITSIKNLSACDKECLVWQDWVDLEEVETVEQRPDDKCIYETEIYLHKPSGQHIGITSQYGNFYNFRIWSFFEDVEIMEKREKATYEWVVKND